MDLSTAAVLKPAHRYRLPALLQDIRLLDLLEISGTTLEAGRICGLSQPTVSRRSRLLADDFNLQVNRRRQQGCRYGTSPTMQLLRRGCRASHALRVRGCTRRTEPRSRMTTLLWCPNPNSDPRRARPRSHRR